MKHTCTMSTRYARDCARGHDGSPAGLMTRVVANTYIAKVVRLVPAVQRMRSKQSHSQKSETNQKCLTRKSPHLAWRAGMSTEVAAVRAPSIMTIVGMAERCGIVTSSVLLSAVAAAQPFPELWPALWSRVLLLLLVSLLRGCCTATPRCCAADCCLGAGGHQQRESRRGRAVRKPIARLAARQNSG